ncbi:MAG: hypothetical protein ACE5HS_22445, partial [bacterium]
MTNQIELFSAAIVHKQKALDALETLSLPQAKTELEIAHDIDPYLADVVTLIQAVDCLLELEVGANTKATGLAKAWHRVQTAGEPLPPTLHRIVETRLCDRILQLLPADYADFVDAQAQTLHIGYCCLVCKRFEEAHKKLLDYLTGRPEETHPRLWGYFGDTAYRLRRRQECNGGYTRALFMDAQTVDLERLQHPDLLRIYKELRSQHPEETARALLPIHAWLENVLHIPRGSAFLQRVIQEQRFDHSAELLLHPAERYHQFALCLFIDQAGL